MNDSMKESSPQDGSNNNHFSVDPIPSSNVAPSKRITIVIIAIAISLCCAVSAAIAVPIIVMALKKSNIEEAEEEPDHPDVDHDLLQWPRQYRAIDNNLEAIWSAERLFHNTLIDQMKQVCGQSYRSKHASNVTCLVHASKYGRPWKLPEKDTSHELWTIAIVEDYESEFTFFWSVIYAGKGLMNGFRPWIGIFTVENPEQCEYIHQTGGARLKRRHTDKATFRTGYINSDGFLNPTYRGRKDWPPDTWVYPANAARKCGLRFRKKMIVK